MNDFDDFGEVEEHSISALKLITAVNFHLHYYVSYKTEIISKRNQIATLQA